MLAGVASAKSICGVKYIICVGEGDGVTKYFRCDIFDNDSVEKKRNVDNKLTKVMGTISFLPVLATTLLAFYVCVHMYVCDCECTV